MMSLITESSLMFGFFERLLDPLRLSRLLADQLLARAHQRTQLLDRFFRDKARLDQAKGRQIGDPGRVVHISLAARHVLDMGRIGQNQLELAVA